MATLVKWTVNTSGKGLYEHQDMLFYEPEPLTKWIRENKSANLTYMKCPSVLEWVKNVYVIRAPFSYSFEFDAETNTIVSQEMDHEFFSRWILVRETNDKKNCFFTLNVAAMFVAENPVSIETLPAMFHDNDFIRKTTWIPGSFDISKWFRHAEATVETRDKKGIIEIKRGDALFYVKLTPEDNGKVTLKKMDREEEIEIQKLSHACVKVKSMQKGFGLKQCYELFAKVKPSRIFKRKCPFGFSK